MQNNIVAKQQYEISKTYELLEGCYRAIFLAVASLEQQTNAKPGTA